MDKRLYSEKELQPDIQADSARRSKPENDTAASSPGMNFSSVILPSKNNFFRTSHFCISDRVTEDFMSRRHYTNTSKCFHLKHKAVLFTPPIFDCTKAIVEEEKLDTCSPAFVFYQLSFLRASINGKKYQLFLSPPLSDLVVGHKERIKASKSQKCLGQEVTDSEVYLDQAINTNELSGPEYHQMEQRSQSPLHPPLPLFTAPTLFPPLPRPPRAYLGAHWTRESQSPSLAGGHCLQSPQGRSLLPFLSQKCPIAPSRRRHPREPGRSGLRWPSAGGGRTRRRRCCALRFGELGLARSARASPDRTRGAFVSRALRSWLRAFGLCSRQAAARAANRVGRRAGIKGPVGKAEGNLIIGKETVGICESKCKTNSSAPLPAFLGRSLSLRKPAVGFCDISLLSLAEVLKLQMFT
ncbi:uncharacterized protein LOC110260475 [Sus scrofa]|uniref:uncharacterized protein LOC110260475 n=1 Tax=Sus scrofa TaxID=9823 RepID=UPI000A2B1BEE|nr:uncharacterized protein LOC110260475 [Sus scrofa]